MDDDHTRNAQTKRSITNSIVCDEAAEYQGDSQSERDGADVSRETECREIGGNGV